MPEPWRVVARPFIPGTTNFGGGESRLEEIVERVLETPEGTQGKIIAELLERHGDQYGDLEAIWQRHYELARQISSRLTSVPEPTTETALLVGAYLTQGYAYEAAALTNPSIVPIGDAVDGTQRFVMSARAVGEGHISSITFIIGSVDRAGQVALDPRFTHVSNGHRSAPEYVRERFSEKLTELGFMDRAAQAIITLLPPRFSPAVLEEAMHQALDVDLDRVELEDAMKRVHWVADSNYELDFDPDLPVSEHLISPAAPAESHGIEDARFVRFTDDDGTVAYYATYTAFDGQRILPQLIETPDFHRFRIATMTGPAVHHKGMALFPRRINGEFVALSRHDHEKCYVMRSDDVRSWSNAELSFGPEFQWETIQTGNCGSPIETEHGWLAITHGVGAMRRYSLGAVLLDLDEPTKVIGRLPSPYIEPEQGEEFGYVPNVVYSCGSMVHEGNLITPFGFADTGISFGVVPLDDLLAEMS